MLLNLFKLTNFVDFLVNNKIKEPNIIDSMFVFAGESTTTKPIHLHWSFNGTGNAPHVLLRDQTKTREPKDIPTE